jgi:DNA-binding transcriptional MocR family regulator
MLQNPTTRTMPERRRIDIAKTAVRLNIRIIEYDPYWLFAENAPPPLARLIPEQVYCVSTLSKFLSPGLRTAFVALPENEDQHAFLVALRTFSLKSPLTTTVVTQWIHDGSPAQLLTGVQAEARGRLRMASGALQREAAIPFSPSCAVALTLHLRGRACRARSGSPDAIPLRCQGTCYAGRTRRPRVAFA